MKGFCEVYNIGLSIWYKVYGAIIKTIHLNWQTRTNLVYKNSHFDVTGMLCLRDTVHMPRISS